MNRFVRAVAVASLLAAPVVLADGATSQAAPIASKPQPANAQVLRGTFNSDGPAVPLLPVRGTFRGSYSSDPHTGTFSNVTTSFKDSYVGD
jgi:hypothetical protein